MQTAQELWQSALGRLRNTLEEFIITHWISKAKPIGVNGTVLVLSVPSQFFSDWLRNHYSDEMAQAIKDASQGKVTGVTFEIEAAPASKPETSTPKDATAPSPMATAAMATQRTIRPRMSFQRHFEHPGNSSARRLAEFIAQDQPPGAICKILILWGKSGCGKTALAEAMESAFKRKNRGLSTAGVSVPEWYRSLQAMWERKRKGEEVSQGNTYNRHACFAHFVRFEDIHILDGNKTKSQEEFFGIIKALCEANDGINRQMVITSQLAPGEIKGLNDEQRTLLNSGISIEIKPPNYQARKGFLEWLACQWGNIIVDDDCLEWLARNELDFRSLTGAINQLRTLCSVFDSEVAISQLDLFDDPESKHRITLAKAQELLNGRKGQQPKPKQTDKKRQPRGGEPKKVGEIVTVMGTNSATETTEPAMPRQRRPEEVTMELIKQVVMEHFDIRPADFYDRKKTAREFSQPRQMAMYLCHTLVQPQPSWQEIGDEFRREHATVMHAVRSVQKRMAATPEEGRILQQLKDKVLTL